MRYWFICSVYFHSHFHHQVFRNKSAHVFFYFASSNKYTSCVSGPRQNDRADNKRKAAHTVSTQWATSVLTPSPTKTLLLPSLFMNIRELMLAGREGRKGLGQREKERMVREESMGGWG